MQWNKAIEYAKTGAMYLGVVFGALALLGSMGTVGIFGALFAGIGGVIQGGILGAILGGGIGAVMDYNAQQKNAQVPSQTTSPAQNTPTTPSPQRGTTQHLASEPELASSATTNLSNVNAEQQVQAVHEVGV